MICWSCEKSAGEGVTCGACGALQPPDASADHFQVLGVERRFALDREALERRYKELTRVLHPDRFARADARARRASLARSVQLNEAWRTLRSRSSAVPRPSRASAAVSVARSRRTASRASPAKKAS